MYWKLALIFLAFVGIDLLGHKLLKVKRNFFEYLLFVLLLAGTIVSAGLQIGSYVGSKNNGKETIYKAAQYLKDGNTQQAELLLAGDCGSYEKEAKVLRAFADLVDKNYIQGYFKLEQLLTDYEFNEQDSKIVNSLQKFCQSEMGLNGGKDAEKTDEELIDEYVGRFEQTSSSSGYYDADSADSSVQMDAEVEDLLDEYVEQLDFTDKEEEEYQETYEVESKLTGDNIETVTLEDIHKIEEQYGNTEDVMRLECKYYVNQNDYDKAQDKAKELVDEYPTEENYVVFTDIIAQEAYSDVSSGNRDALDTSDEEVGQLVKDADKKMEQAQKMSDSSDEDAQEEKDLLLEEAEELYEEAHYVMVRRAVNYIIAKEPIGGDKTGLCDLQLAKLYLVMGDRDTADRYLYQVINNSLDISEDSSIKEALDELMIQYNQLTGDELNAEFNRAINDLIKAQSSGVVPNNETTINGSFDSYVTNTLKYDKINIHISKIDTSKYPEIKAYVNINGYKDGNSELASEFEKEDFDLIDTQYEIPDFELIKDDSDQISIAIVMDRSGSMQGYAIENAKNAAEEVVNHMETDNQKVALVTYNDSATLDKGLTNKQNTLKQEIRSVDANGGTNISAGLFAALDEIEDESGSRAVILMSDGQDGGSRQDMEYAIEQAIEQGICVYTVAFGESEDAYMEWIAESTGGKFMKASDSSELADIYLTLQKYIVNNYCLKYTVTKNEEVSARYLIVNIDEYGTSATKEYYLKEDSEEEEENLSNVIEKLDEDAIGISSITPGTVSRQNVENGVEITITGTGFADNMNITIGKLPLNDIKVQDSTTLTGTLKGTLEMGTYNVRIKTDSGKMAIANKKFKVTRAGVATSIRIGTDLMITADSIGQTENNVLVASGNVLVNGFLHFSDDMSIKVSDMPSDLELKPGVTIKVGNSATLSGDAKIYVSYGDFTDEDDSFTSMLLKGKDYVVQNGEYSIDVSYDTCSFNKDIGKPKLGIPHILEIDSPASFKIGAKGIFVSFSSVNPREIVDNFNAAMKGNDDSADGDATDAGGQKVYRDKYEATAYDFMDSDLNFYLVIRPDKMIFGGEANFNVNDSIQFGNIGINSVGLKLNSGDEDHEYWKLSGAIDFGKRISGFGGSISGISGSISSYYWLPDKIALDLDTDIVVYKIINIEKLKGSVQGISTIILKLYETIVSPENYQILGTGIGSDEYKGSEVILKASAEATINLLSSFYNDNGKAKYAIVDKIKELGELGDVTGEMSINFTNPEFKLGAEMNFFKDQKATGNLVINGQGLDIAAKLNLQKEFKGLKININGNAETNLGGNAEGIYANMGVDGSVKCKPIGVDASGQVSVGIKFDWDMETASATIRYGANGATTEKTLWYNRDGNLLLGDKKKFEVTTSVN